MLDNRLKLHAELVLVSGLGDNIYYQPPESIKIQFPAIVYKRSTIDNTFASNDVYKQDYKYEITVIDKDPDSLIVSKISKMKNIRHVRHYKSNNANYDVFTIIFTKTN